MTFEASIMQTRFQQILIALHTILTKEIVRFVRIWTQTLLPPQSP